MLCDDQMLTAIERESRQSRTEGEELEVAEVNVIRDRELE